MHPYIIVLILSALFASAHAGAIFVQDAPRRTNHLAAAILGCSAYWSICQVLWNTAESADAALFYMRMSSPGWIALAPVAVHLILRSLPARDDSVRTILPWLYLASALFVGIDWFTPWTRQGAVPTSWGWTYRLGPGFYANYLFAASVASLGVIKGLRASHSSISPAERRQVRLIAWSLVVPICVGSITDGLLPLLEIPFPPLGSVSLAFLGVVSATSMRRHGYSALVPRTLTKEILATLPDGVSLLFLDGRIRSCNEVLADLAGVPAPDLEERPVAELVSVSTEELSAELRNHECRLVSRDGEKIPVSISTQLLRDRQGLEIGIVLVVHDQREVVELRTRLVTSGRLAAVGELAAGVAHEINNPLTYIRANLSLLQSHWSTLCQELDKQSECIDPTLDDIRNEGVELIDESLEGVERAASIVRDVRGLSYGGKSERQPTNLKSLLDGVIRIAGPQLRQSASITTSFEAVPQIQCTPHELTQVFLNLVINAGQAMTTRGQLHLAVERDGDSVVVRVEDTGGGIDPAAADRIFDPFFTTKPVGQGTGLGLAISHEIIRNHSGEITFADRPGGGTVFFVRLPLVGTEDPPHEPDAN